MYGVVNSLLDESFMVHILVDQLDDFWKGTDQQIASLCALINAVMRMKSVLLQRRMDRSLRFSVFLRSDIYEVLKRNGLDDASKYRRHELHLKWDRAALCRMIERRLEVAEVDDVRTMDDLFADGRLERRSLIDYFFWRVVPRPRDAIQFLAFSLERAYEFDQDQVTSEALADAEATYSGWRRDVILEETRYGGLRAPDAVLDSMSSGPRTFTSREMNRRLDAAKKDYGLTETKPQIIAAMADWGVLGVQRPNGENLFIWDVPEGKRPTVDKDDDAQEIYVVHPSLWSSLDLRASRKQKARSQRSAETR